VHLRRSTIRALRLRTDEWFDTDSVFAGIVVLTIFALILHFIVTKIESRLLIWPPGTAETEAL